MKRSELVSRTRQLIGEGERLQVSPSMAALRVWLKLTDELTVIPGARVDWFSDVEELSFDPRVVARWRFAPDWTAKGGVGLVHQPPTPQETDEVFGNPELGLQRAKLLLELAAGVAGERHLAPGGVFGLNLAGGLNDAFSRAMYRTIRTRFDQVHVFLVRGAPNVLLLASRDAVSLSPEELVRRGRELDEGPPPVADGDRAVVLGRAPRRAELARGTDRLDRGRRGRVSGVAAKER